MKASELLREVAGRLDQMAKKVNSGQQPCPYLCIEVTRVIARDIAPENSKELLALKERVCNRIVGAIVPHTSLETWLASNSESASRAMCSAVAGSWEEMQKYHIALTRHRAAWARRLAKDFEKEGD